MTHRRVGVLVALIPRIGTLGVENPLQHGDSQTTHTSGGVMRLQSSSAKEKPWGALLRAVAGLPMKQVDISQDDLGDGIAQAHEKIGIIIVEKEQTLHAVDRGGQGDRCGRDATPAGDAIGLIDALFLGPVGRQHEIPQGLIIHRLHAVELGALRARGWPGCRAARW